MNYTVVSSCEWTYPDQFDYATASPMVNLFSAQGSYASAQVLFRGADEKFKVYATGQIDAEIYQLVPVYVEDNPGFTKENSTPHYPERKAPFYVYDCIKPLGDENEIVPDENKSAGVYVSVNTANMLAGTYKGCICASGNSGNITIIVTLTVFNVKIPDESLKIIMGYNRGAVEKYHNINMGTPEFGVIEDKYFSMMRRMRQNMLYVGGVRTEKTGENEYSFDFSEMERFVEKAMKHGFEYFNAPSIGGRKSWSESTILVNGMPSMSYEAYCYLNQYLPKLREFLIRKGWLDCFYMGIADEPNEHNATEFRALCGLVHRIFPEIKLIDAMSYGNIHGSLDVYVPLNAEFDRHMKEFDTYRTGNSEIWHYVCCGPRGDKYINRFMDYPLLATKYLYWGNYKYDLKGYLHWAVNHYQPNQDPFTQNCPQHTNCDSTCILPPGDSHIIYPGDNNEPWMSMRLEAQRESAEEYELLKLLASHNKNLADKYCEKCFHSFQDVEYDPKKYLRTKRAILESIEEIKK